MTKSVFDQTAVWPHAWAAEITVTNLLGGTPADPKLVEGWLAGQLRSKDPAQKKAAIARIIGDAYLDTVETTLSMSEAEQESVMMSKALEQKGLQVFKRGPGGVLCEEGRKIAAMLKEAAAIQWIGDKTARPAYMRKAARSWWPEHVFIVDQLIPLGRTEPDEVLQRPVHTTDTRGNPQSSIAVQELIREAVIPFTIRADVEIPDTDWAKVFSRGEVNGFGATRSQGYGRFVTTRFDRIS